MALFADDINVCMLTFSYSVRWISMWSNFRRYLILNSIILFFQVIFKVICKQISNVKDKKTGSCRANCWKVKVKMIHYACNIRHCIFYMYKITSHLPVILLIEKKSFDRADSYNNRVKIYILSYFSLLQNLK